MLGEFIEYIDNMFTEAGVQPAMDAWHDDFVYLYKKVRLTAINDILDQAKKGK